VDREVKRQMSNMALFKKIKDACSEYLKEEGIYQATLKEILFTFHVVSYDLLYATINVELESKKNQLAKETPKKWFKMDITDYAYKTEAEVVSKKYDFLKSKGAGISLYGTARLCYPELTEGDWKKIVELIEKFKTFENNW